MILLKVKTLDDIPYLKVSNATVLSKASRTMIPIPLNQVFQLLFMILLLILGTFFSRSQTYYTSYLQFDMKPTNPAMLSS